jgi:isopentenyl phosphate kinase
MITLLKLGGSVITEKSKPYTARNDHIKRLAEEIADAIKDEKLKLIVGNGGGSFPHQPAKKGKLKDGIKDAWQLEHMAETHRAAGELNHIMVSALVKEGVPAIGIKPSSAGYADNDKIVDFNILMIEELIKLNAVPVVHGDVLVDLKKGCSIASTERIFQYIASLLPVKRIIIGTNVDGVLDSDGQVIPEINPQNFDDVRKHLKGAADTDVTGGMLHKVESMLELAKMGHEIAIVNALTPNNIKKALEGEPLGTLIHG